MVWSPYLVKIHVTILSLFVSPHRVIFLGICRNQWKFRWWINHQFWWQFVWRFCHYLFHPILCFFVDLPEMMRIKVIKLALYLVVWFPSGSGNLTMYLVTIRVTICHRLSGLGRDLSRSGPYFAVRAGCRCQITFWEFFSFSSSSSLLTGLLVEMVAKDDQAT